MHPSHLILVDEVGGLGCGVGAGVGIGNRQPPPVGERPQQQQPGSAFISARDQLVCSPFLSLFLFFSFVPTLNEPCILRTLFLLMLVGLGVVRVGVLGTDNPRLRSRGPSSSSREVLSYRQGIDWYGLCLVRFCLVGHLSLCAVYPPRGAFSIVSLRPYHLFNPAETKRRLTFCYPSARRVLFCLFVSGVHVCVCAGGGGGGGGAPANLPLLYPV